MWGSISLVKTLLAQGLVDELNLMIEPILLGGGKRILLDDEAVVLRVRRGELVGLALGGAARQVVARLVVAGVGPLRPVPPEVGDPVDGEPCHWGICTLGEGR